MQQFLQFIILTFIYSSTCFGRPHANHQELNNCSGSLWFLPSERGDSSAVGRGRAGHTGPTTANSTATTTLRRQKPEAATAIVELLMMGVRTPETCRAVNKRQDNKLEKLLRIVGDLFETCSLFVRSLHKQCEGLHKNPCRFIWRMS